MKRHALMYKAECLLPINSARLYGLLHTFWMSVIPRVHWCLR